jgi:hypothetical protein
MKKISDWDKIMEEISSGEDSDEHDTPNIVSLKKHGPKLMEMVSNILEEQTIPKVLKNAHQKAMENRCAEPITQDFKQVEQEVHQSIKDKDEKKEKTRSS